LGVIVKKSRTQPQIFPTHMPETPRLPLPPLPKTPPSPFQPWGYGAEGQGWNRFYGLPGLGASRGLDNSPEDGLLTAISGCGGKPGWLERAGKANQPRGLAKKETVSVRRRPANRDRPIPSVCRVFKRSGRDATTYFRDAAKQRPPLGLSTGE
jgi:hypothetical protein